jgi:hypothetical protein
MLEGSKVKMIRRGEILLILPLSNRKFKISNSSSLKGGGSDGW